MARLKIQIFYLSYQNYRSDAQQTCLFLESYRDLVVLRYVLLLLVCLFDAAERIVQRKICAKRMRIQLLARTIDSQEEKVLLLLSTVLPLADKI